MAQTTCFLKGATHFLIITCLKIVSSTNITYQYTAYDVAKSDFKTWMKISLNYIALKYFSRTYLKMLHCNLILSSSEVLQLDIVMIKNKAIQKKEIKFPYFCFHGSCSRLFGSFEDIIDFPPHLNKLFGTLNIGAWLLNVDLRCLCVKEMVPWLEGTKKMNHFGIITKSKQN